MAKKSKKIKLSPTIISTLILTAAGIISRIIGFFYRIFLSNTIGANGIGLYSLIMPVFTICFSICGGAYQTTISAFIAAGGNKKKCKGAFLSGTIMSLSSSLILSGIIYFFSDYISIHILFEEKCSPLIKLLAFTIPLSSIHACINGYFYGIIKSGFPAISQLIEQTGRVVWVYLLWVLSIRNNSTISASSAVAGMLAGEACAVAFLSISLLFSTIRNRHQENINTYNCHWNMFVPVFKMSFPLILNKLLLSILSGIEAVWIPLKLQLAGMSSEKAISYYGILNGMSMPFILFPSALTNSLAVILLPDIAKSKAEKDIKKISETSSENIHLCLVLGVIFTGIFFFYGEDMGMLIFKEQSAGIYIKNLSLICPFIYLSTTVCSILNGLGKTGTTFIQNCISTLIRLFFVYSLIPVYGMKAYLWGVLASWITLTSMNIISLYKEASFHFSFFKSIIWPCMVFMSAYLLVELIKNTVRETMAVSPLLSLAVSVALVMVLSFYICLFFPKANKQKNTSKMLF